MNLREQILAEHSKSQCTRIVKWVGASQKRFDELFFLFLNDEYRVTQRAAWPLAYCAIEHPGFIKSHFKELLDNLNMPGLHSAVKRNTIRILEVVSIPEKYEGQVMGLCLHYLEDPGETVAVKAYSISVLQVLSKKYPDIIREVRLLIQEQMPQQTAAFKSKAKKFLKENGEEESEF